MTHFTLQNDNCPDLKSNTISQIDIYLTSLKDQETTCQLSHIEINLKDCLDLNLNITIQQLRIEPLNDKLILNENLENYIFKT